ncbi:MAG: hypothetical protein RLZZ169_920, partial [Pseudomonadota bacterium]
MRGAAMVASFTHQRRDQNLKEVLSKLG